MDELQLARDAGRLADVVQKVLMGSPFGPSPVVATMSIRVCELHARGAISSNEFDRFMELLDIWSTDGDDSIDSVIAAVEMFHATVVHEGASAVAVAIADIARLGAEKQRKGMETCKVVVAGAIAGAFAAVSAAPAMATWSVMGAVLGSAFACAQVFGKLYEEVRFSEDDELASEPDEDDDQSDN
jgi:hypothetical protein